MAKIVWNGDAFIAKIDAACMAAGDQLADLMAEEARIRAPYDPKHRGNEPHLRDSIEPIKAYQRGNSIAFGVQATNSYTLDIELGHRTRSGSFVAPQPFLRPAYDTYAGQVVSFIKRNVA